MIQDRIHLQGYLYNLWCIGTDISAYQFGTQKYIKDTDLAYQDGDDGYILIYTQYSNTLYLRTNR